MPYFLVRLNLVTMSANSVKLCKKTTEGTLIATLGLKKVSHSVIFPIFHFYLKNVGKVYCPVIKN